MLLLVAKIKPRDDFEFWLGDSMLIPGLSA